MDDDDLLLRGLRGELAALEEELRVRGELADDHARVAVALRRELDGMQAELAQVRRELARTRFVTEFAERLASIEDAGRRGAYVDLLEAYAHPAPLTDRVELGSSLARALDAHESRLRGVQLTCRLDDEVGLHGARRELGLVWSALIANAADALAGAGTLTVFTARAGAWLAVSFLDDGPGLPPPILAALFEPFVTSRPPSLNLGVGLYLARCFVERHAGRVELESAPGRTRVTVALPVGPSG